MNKPTFVIVGAGKAGATAAAELRRNNFDGRIVLLGEESSVPYDRPPLSKNMLLHPENSSCNIFPDDFYVKNNIELKLGARVDEIDLVKRQVRQSTNEIHRFDKLLLTTGASVRRLPMLDKLGANVYILRTLDDTRELLPVLRPDHHIILIGGGVIGLELASSARTLGAKVTVIEQAPVLMGRCSPPLLSEYLRAQHQAHGVVVHTGLSMVDARCEGKRIIIDLQDGSQIAGDAVIYGVGAQANTLLASKAGLQVDHGILVDEHCMTSHQDVYAAGDVTRQWDPLRAQYQRRETWENAQNQAISAARSMQGIDLLKNGPPWFWSDQYEMNIQFAGDMAAREWVVRGTMDMPRFMLFGIHQQEIVAAIAVNLGREMRSAKMLIEAHAKMDLTMLCDERQDLRVLTKNVLLSEKV